MALCRSGRCNVTTISSPAAGNPFYSVLDAISGVVDDQPDNALTAPYASQNESVLIRIRDLSLGGKYWDVDSTTWTVAVSSQHVMSWMSESLPNYANNWESGHQYEAIAYGRDAADVAIYTQFGDPVELLRMAVSVERLSAPPS